MKRWAVRTAMWSLLVMWAGCSGNAKVGTSDGQGGDGGETASADMAETDSAAEIGTPDSEVSVGDGEMSEVTPECRHNEDCVHLLPAESACWRALCQPDPGICVLEPVADGTACNDGEPCTVDESCHGGQCGGGVTRICDDGNPCTDDRCATGLGCRFDDNDKFCDDGNPCTALDRCESGVCHGNAGSDLCPCTQQSDCAVYDDDDACNGYYRCQAGACVPLGAVVCPAPDDPCRPLSCDPQTGQCEEQPGADGAACDDADPCTTEETCLAGVCRGGTTVCPCGRDEDCIQFDDANLCNGTYLCFEGFCLPNPTSVVVCAAADSCKTNVCQPETGDCVPQPAVDGTACTDSDACTDGDLCQQGRCEPGPARLCDDADPCTFDGCHNWQGCRHVPRSGPCDDGDACSEYDRCLDGDCQGLPVDCDDRNPCTDDSCDPAVGCRHAPNVNACTDDNPCTTGDFCQAGVCRSGLIDVCGPCLTDEECTPFEDGNRCNGITRCVDGVCQPDPATIVECPQVDLPCQQNLCNPIHGDCRMTLLPDGTACDEGDACSWAGMCSAGACQGLPVDCNDDNPCTTDTCDVVVGCLHENNTGPCNDGDPCTQFDTCAAGYCQAGTGGICPFCVTDHDCAGLDPNLCDGLQVCQHGRCVPDPMLAVVCPAPDDLCRQTTCLPDSGQCQTDFRPDGAPCDDKDACTRGDSCNGQTGDCQGTAVDCDDHNPCTEDVCDPLLGCRYGPLEQECDDGNACTQGDQCVAGRCAGGAPVVCQDDDLCTDDICDPDQGGCIFPFNMAPCDDGNACTANDTCGVGQCLGDEVSCDDGNLCTDDLCNAENGCQHADNSQFCEDGEPCTANDYCQGGQCRPGAFTCFEACTNAQDDDGDGLVDCQDPDCEFTPFCTGVGMCEPAAVLSCGDAPVAADLSDPLVTTDQVTGYNCTTASYPGPEYAVEIAPGCNGLLRATVTVDGSLFPTQPRLDVMAVVQSLDSCQAATRCVAHGLMVYNGGIGRAEITFSVLQDQTYYVVVDGRNGAVGGFGLEVTCLCP